MKLSLVLLNVVVASCTLVFAEAFPLGFFPSPDNLPGHHVKPSPLPVAAKLLSSDGNDDHSYIRPPVAETAGFPKNNAANHRSPCPCLNSLANHGYISRDGKNITPQMLKQAVMDVFHLSDGLAQALVGSLPSTLTLADLGEHNFIEHDASLVHDDLFFGQDPSQVNATLVNQLLARATQDGTLTKEVIVRWRHEREAQSAATNPNYDFDVKQQAGALGESAAFLVALGDYDSESISVAHAESFLLHERIPDDFVRSQTEITVPHAVYVVVKLKALSVLPQALLRAA